MYTMVQKAHEGKHRNKVSSFRGASAPQTLRPDQSVISSRCASTSSCGESGSTRSYIVTSRSRMC